jgi:hypothetical protein
MGRLTVRMAVGLVVLGFLIGETGQARADIIYSNFGPGQSYSPGGYSVTGGVLGGSGPPTGFGFAIAESFAPWVNFLFSSVKLP